MKTWTWKTGDKLPLAVAVLALLGTAGCAHRELMAPCSDYKAARFAPTGPPGTVPCDTPLPMARPPWTAALARPPAGPVGGG